MELQQRSPGVLILVRSMIFEDNWLLKETGEIVLICVGLHGPTSRER